MGRCPPHNAKSHAHICVAIFNIIIIIDYKNTKQKSHTQPIPSPYMKSGPPHRSGECKWVAKTQDQKTRYITSTALCHVRVWPRLGLLSIYTSSLIGHTSPTIFVFIFIFLFVSGYSNESI